MTTAVDKPMFRFAGSFVHLSLVLAQIHSANWPWVTAFVGLNMLQASVTGRCSLAGLLRRLGAPTGAAFCAPRSV